MTSVTVPTLIKNALAELNVYQPSQTVAPADAELALSKLNRLFNNWNGLRQATFSNDFITDTLVPTLSPHTIGPTGTFVVDQRPVTVDGIDLILTNVSPPVRVPIRMRDKQWYLSLSVPEIQVSTPTDCYYNPSWPNGQLYFYPVPNTAYDVVLLLRHTLDDELTLASSLSFPPGYEDAVTLTLAVDCSAVFGREAAQSTIEAGRRARSAVFQNNDWTPRISTADAGMPGGNRPAHKPDFFWPSGQIK